MTEVDWIAHPTAALDYHGEPVEIDVELGDLMTEIWRLHINTTDLARCRARDGPG